MHRSKLAKLERAVHELLTREPDDRADWQPWPGEKAAWDAAPPAERQRLRELFVRMGGTQESLMVCRREDGTWTLSTFNLPYGRACYFISSTWQEMGHEPFWDWLEAHMSPEEAEVFVRLCEADWVPEALQDGDTERLWALAERLPKRTRL